MESTRTRDFNQVDNRVDGRTASVTRDINDAIETDVDQQVNQRVPRETDDRAALLQRLDEMQARLERLEKEVEDRNDFQSRNATQCFNNRLGKEKEIDKGMRQGVIKKRKLNGSSGSNKRFKRNSEQRRGCEKQKSGTGPSASVIKGIKRCVPCGSSHVGDCTIATQRCFNCGKLGHKGRECTAAAIVCFSCQEEGHKSSDCPKKMGVANKKEEYQKGEVRVLHVDDVDN